MSQALKILHAAETIKGGVASYLDEIIPYQQEIYGQSGVRVLVPDEHADQLRRTPRPNVCTFHRSKRGISAALAFGRELLKEVTTFKPDILLLHSSFAGFIGRVLVPFMNNPRPKIIYCAHGWAFVMDNALWKKRVYGFVESALSLLTDKIINISQHEHNAARLFGISEKKMVTIYSGIKPLMDFPPPKVISAGGKKSFLFVGRFDRQKGFDLLLNALALIPEPDFIIRAVGSSVIDEADFNVPPCVELLGWQSRDAITRFYREADALIMPSRWEGLSLVALEAMSCGTPVLASNRTSLPEMVAHGRTGMLFDPEDSKVFAELLCKVSREELAQMGTAAAEDARGRFSAKGMNEEIVSLYERL